MNARISNLRTALETIRLFPDQAANRDLTLSEAIDAITQLATDALAADSKAAAEEAVQ